MSNAISRLASADELNDLAEGINVLNIECSIEEVDEPKDHLRRLPTEIRLMIFEEVLVIKDSPVFRGAWRFGPLDFTEFNGDIQIPWQILLVCRLYHEEASSVLYSKNHLIFCTGDGGSPGCFWRFPVKVHYMEHLTNLGIYLCCDDPSNPAAKRIGHFMDALVRRTKNLMYLTVLISSDGRYEAQCPWDIMFCDHPVAKALVKLVESKKVRHLKLRMHDGALLFPGFACYLLQTFNKDGPQPHRSITFTSSCTCPHLLPSGITGTQSCLYCAWPWFCVHLKPIEMVVPPVALEADQEHMMDMQHELFQRGILPPKDDDEEDDEDAAVGPYGGGPPIEDTYEENRKAFHSGMLLPGEIRRYRGGLVAPREWSFKQTLVTDFFWAEE